MKKLKIVFLGAGSGFVISVARELLTDPIFEEAALHLVDIDAERLQAAKQVVEAEFKNSRNKLYLSCTTDRREVLPDADYVISSCEPNRYQNWYKDLAIPEEFGCFQVKGENGGPGGIMHSLRNINMLKPIFADMRELCPNALFMNFTNPMSFICTYAKNFAGIKTLGFCHQVHGSFGVIAEMLGFAPGDLEVVSAGVNHLNWLFDIRKKGSRTSFMAEFSEMVKASKYWQKRFYNIPEQNFTLEFFKTFNMYPIGYDTHVIEYIPFFWNKPEWPQYEVESLTETYRKMAEKKEHVLEIQRLLGKEYDKPPFPVNPDHPYYAESPCKVITALESNTPTYFDAINIKNNGAIDNLPPDVILDVPALCVGGEMRSIHVGALPPGPLEICRRQTALHEMVAQAAETNDESLLIQAFCLSPYVTSVTQAKQIWQAYKKAFKEYLPGF